MGNWAMFCKFGAEIDGMGYVLNVGIPIGPPGTLFLAPPSLDEVSPMRYPPVTLLLLLMWLLLLFGAKFGTLAVMPQ